MAMIQRRNPSRILFNICNYTFLVLISVSIIIPFLNCFALSLSSYEAIKAGEVSLWPVGFNLKAYREIFDEVYFMRNFCNTVFLTVVNTCALITISLLAGYALQSKYCKHQKLKTLFILIPMYFGGGLIPSYILINSWLNLRDNYLALMLPVVVSPFLIVIFRNNIANLPREMSESAELDGASDFTVLWRILLPLILPTVIAFIISNAVGYWNEWFNCMIYIQSPEKFTMQYKLRSILNTASLQTTQGKQLGVSVEQLVHPQNIKMASLLVTILPIMLIYPFLQRYFIHGVIVGALKG